MGYLDQHANESIEDIKDALKQQFKKPKAYSQIVNDLKDFKKGPSESVRSVIKKINQRRRILV